MYSASNEKNDNFYNSDIDDYLVFETNNNN